MGLPEIEIQETVDFLAGLLNTPSPTGDTEQAMQYVEHALAGLPLTMRRTRKGALLIIWPGDTAHPRALTAHVDTLGAVVRAIKDNGRLELTPLGSYDWHCVETEGCWIVTHTGKRYRGSILPLKASVHIYGPESRELERCVENYEVRLDERVTDSYEVEQLHIQVGDFVYIDPRVEVSDSGFVRSRYLDDKAGVACIYSALRALYRAGLSPRYHTTTLISNYEEVGHGAAAGIPADVEELVAVDMAAAGGPQNSDEFSAGICAKDSGGPYDLTLRRRLEALCREYAIPCKVDIYPFYGSDGEAAWQAGADLKVGLVGPGVDASHSYERTHRDSLAATVRLLLAYLLSE